MNTSYFEQLETATVGHNTTGRKHREAGDPCEDSWMSLSRENYTIIAVADGLGSADLSTVGSDIATQEAVSKTAEYIDDLSEHDSIDSIASFDESAVSKILRNVIKHARGELVSKAESDGEPLNKYHTTLTVAIHTPYWYGACAIGDSGIIGGSEDEYRRLLDREDTESSEATVPLTSDTRMINERYRLVYDDTYIPFIAAFTDGFDRFAWEMNDQAQPRTEFFDRIHSFIQSTDHLQSDQTVDEFTGFVESDHFDEHDSDDKTLVISYIPFVDSVVSDDTGCLYNDAEFVEAIAEHQPATSEEISSSVGCSIRTVTRRMDDLIERGVIQSVVNDEDSNNSRWKLTNLVSV
jgi:hypothetical protein